MRTSDLSSSAPVNVTATAAGLGWLWVLTSDAVLHAGFAGMLAVAMMYLLSVVALFTLARKGISLHGVALVACILAAALLSFTASGNLLVSIPQPHLSRDYPIFLRRTTLFIPGTISAVVVFALVIVPASLLSERARWIIPMLTSVATAYLSHESLLGSDGQPFVRVVLWFEFLAYAVVMPVLLALSAPILRQRVLNAA